MTIKTSQDSDDSLFFCTFTCFNWIPLFEITNFYSEIYKWFDILVERECKIIAYVIMPNHCHFIVFVPSKENISKLVANGKRFMAYEIVKRLQNIGKLKLLKYLEESVDPNEKKIGKRHNVFQPSFDAKPIFSEKFLFQKLDYIHHNPVSGKWNLVEVCTEYEHSSAKYYEFGEFGIYPVTHYEDVFG